MGKAGRGNRFNPAEIGKAFRRLLPRRCYNGHRHLLVQECHLVADQDGAGQLCLSLFRASFLRDEHLEMWEPGFFVTE